jgi:hypothetical protein
MDQGGQVSADKASDTGSLPQDFQAGDSFTGVKNTCQLLLKPA